MFIFDEDIKIGDTVEIVQDNAIFGSNTVGKKGKVKRILPTSVYPYIVEFDEPLGSLALPYHPRYGVKNGYGRQYGRQELRLVKASKQKPETKVQDMKVITRGNEVIVVLKDENGAAYKRGVAKCHVDDKFDFFTGLQVALAKALDENIPLLSNDEIDKVDIKGSVYKNEIAQQIILHRGNAKFEFPIIMEHQK